MTALERAARAVNDAEAQWSLEPTGTRSEMIARTVLMAVREPSSHSCIAGGIAMCEARETAETSVDEASATFIAMIDAILNEKE